MLQEILPVLEAQEDYSNDALYQTLLKYVEQKGCKNGYVMWPIRTAVSGKQMTPAGATGDYGSPGQRGISGKNPQRNRVITGKCLI